MATYGYGDNYCKVEVFSKQDTLENYRTKRKCVDMELKGTVKMLLNDNTEYRFYNTSSVTSSSLTFIVPTCQKGDVWENVTSVQTGNCAPKLSVETTDGKSAVMITYGGQIPTYMKMNQVYTFHFWYDGYSLCSETWAYGYA